MKTKLKSIYKDMSQDELARAAFSSIGTQNTSIWKSVEANVKCRSYFGQDINFTNNVDNRVNFSIYFGLQYHKNESYLNFNLHLKQLLGEKRDDDSESEKLENEILELYGKKANLCVLFNTICNNFNIDKYTSLQLAQINITPIELDNVANDAKFHALTKESSQSINDIEFILESTLRRNM